MTARCDELQECVCFHTVRREGGFSGVEVRDLTSPFCSDFCFVVPVNTLALTVVGLCSQAAGAVPRPHGLLHVQHGESLTFSIPKIFFFQPPISVLAF